MKKQRKLNEEQLRKVVAESVKNVLNEVKTNWRIASRYDTANGEGFPEKFGGGQQMNIGQFTDVQLAKFASKYANEVVFGYYKVSPQEKQAMAERISKDLYDVLTDTVDNFETQLEERYGIVIQF